VHRDLPSTAVEVADATHELVRTPVPVPGLPVPVPEVPLTAPRRRGRWVAEWVTVLVVALLLATLGVYGVMSFSVAQRNHEIALRMALGSTRTRVISLIVREGLALAAVGLALGLVGAYFVGRSMQTTLYGIGKLDLTVFASVATLLLIAAITACFVPARRAASVNPMQALRSE